MDLNAMVTAIMFADPMEQFEILRIFPVGTEGLNLDFTNASLWMVIAVAVASLFMFAATSKAALVPSRFQSAGEVIYEFVAGMLRDACGNEGMKFFPYMFTLFIFIFLCNLLGLIPSIPGTPSVAHVFTPTSHLIVTLALAMTSFLIVVIYGFYKNGLGFLKIFAPSGVPLAMMFIIVPLEIVSFLSRPLSLGIRLFANMLAGHLILKLFAGFVASLLVAGPAVMGLAIFPFLGNVAIYLLELLIAFLQAYVFTILSCVYLADAVHASDH